jgi:phosphoribosylaminoimidazolecarboxamide formyltransferase / IMP cyclohydrolase
VFRRALISVSDKSGLDELVQGLRQVAPDCEFLSTGGTAKTLRECGTEPVEISEFTGFPECFGGRVKTLQPEIHGGILFRRGRDEEEAARVGIEPIDLVVVNLYPFQLAYSEGSKDLTEMIDIGGPTLLRAAAKNCESVIVLCDPDQYGEFLRRAQDDEIDLAYRQRLRADVFARTAAYDAAISAAFTDEPYPQKLTLSFERKTQLRYGENPHQSAAVYQQQFSEGGLSDYTLHQGKALSYNNLLDASASLLPLRNDRQSWCCVVKHAAPCGLSVAADNAGAFEMAWAGDPVSAFGSVVSFSRAIQGTEAELLAKKFIEVVVAPGFSDEARKILSAKTNLRLVEVKLSARERPVSYQQNVFLQDGLALIQQPDQAVSFQLTQANEHSGPSEELIQFGLRAVGCIKSNGICLVRACDRGLQTIGLGGGQPNRVQSLRIAIANAKEHFGEEAMQSALLVSDAFFPFPDSIELAASVGIPWVVSPSGSKKDGEVAEAAQRLGVSLTFVDHRLFRH